MPMYNMLGCSQNNSMISGSLWNYHRDESDHVNDNPSDGKSFKYKTKTVGKTREGPERPSQPPQSRVGTHDHHNQQYQL